MRAHRRRSDAGTGGRVRWVPQAIVIGNTNVIMLSVRGYLVPYAGGNLRRNSRFQLKDANYTPETLALGMDTAWKGHPVLVLF
jgi:hypothetical protein